MSDNRRSKTITQSMQRSPNRALLCAAGHGDKDCDKPIVGVANAHSTITPCTRAKPKCDHYPLHSSCVALETPT